MSEDIGPSAGVVANREVQPRRGKRTDVVIEAALPNSREGFDKLAVVIEVKGCWHSEVRTALKTQLVDDYLIAERQKKENPINPVIPFETGKLHHIFRATVPFITDDPNLHSGLSDITLFDLMVFNQKWGRWGVGPVALLPTGGSSRGADQWALGPAVGFTSIKGKFLWGAFNQNLFTYAGDDDRTPVNVSVLQPILNYGLGHGWSVGSSEMTFTYDWQNDRWSNLPLGGKVAKLIKFGKLPVQCSLQYEHNFSDEIGDPSNTVRFTMKFLFPKL